MLARRPLLALAPLALCLPAAAQILQAELKVGDPIDPPGHVVLDIGQVAGGHWAVTLRSLGSLSTLSQVYGTCCYDVVPGTAAASSTVGTFVQTSFKDEAAFVGANEAVYCAIGIDTASGAFDVDSVWSSGLVAGPDTLHAQEGKPVPGMTGLVWGALDRPSAYYVTSTFAHEPTWLGELRDAGSGSLVGRGLFHASGALPFVKSGDVLAGTGGPVAVPGLDDRYAVSNDGHWLAQVETTEPAGSNRYLVLDGAVLQVGGAPLRQGGAVPASIGGLPGERWESFGEVGLFWDGTAFFTANTDGPAGSDEVLVKHGQIHLREGDPAGGAALSGAISWARPAGLDRVALVWGLSGPGGTVEAALIDCEVLARVGDLVDLDGDGQVEPGSVLSDIGSVQQGELSQAFLVGSVDVSGTPTLIDDVKALLRVQASPGPYGIGKLNSIGIRSQLTGSGTPSATSNAFELEVRWLVPSNVGLAFWGSGEAQIPFANHFLYVAPPVNRILPPHLSPALGLPVEVPIDITPAMVGTTRTYQYWSRDPSHPDGTGVELSNGLRVHFCP